MSLSFASHHQVLKPQQALKCNKFLLKLQKTTEKTHRMWVLQQTDLHPPPLLSVPSHPGWLRGDDKWLPPARSWGTVEVLLAARLWGTVCGHEAL